MSANEFSSDVSSTDVPQGGKGRPIVSDTQRPMVAVEVKDDGESKVIELKDTATGEELAVVNIDGEAASDGVLDARVYVPSEVFADIPVESLQAAFGMSPNSIPDSYVPFRIVSDLSQRFTGGARSVIDTATELAAQIRAQVDQLALALFAPDLALIANNGAVVASPEILAMAAGNAPGFGGAGYGPGAGPTPTPPPAGGGNAGGNTVPPAGGGNAAGNPPPPVGGGGGAGGGNAGAPTTPTPPVGGNNPPAGGGNAGGGNNPPPPGAGGTGGGSRIGDLASSVRTHWRPIAAAGAVFVAGGLTARACMPGGGGEPIELSESDDTPNPMPQPTTRPSTTTTEVGSSGTTAAPDSSSTTRPAEPTTTVPTELYQLRKAAGQDPWALTAEERERVADYLPDWYVSLDIDGSGHVEVEEFAIEDTDLECHRREAGIELGEELVASDYLMPQGSLASDQEEIAEEFRLENPFVWAFCEVAEESPVVPKGRTGFPVERAGTLTEREVPETGIGVRQLGSNNNYRRFFDETGVLIGAFEATGTGDNLEWEAVAPGSVYTTYQSFFYNYGANAYTEIPLTND